jgi:hypothetical protein
LQLPPGYEDLLAEFAHRYPAWFWQLNFWGIVGGLAVGLDIADWILGGFVVLPAWGRLLIYLLPAAGWASLVQRRYRQRNTQSHTR